MTVDTTSRAVIFAIVVAVAVLVGFIAWTARRQRRQREPRGFEVLPPQSDESRR